MRRAAHDVLVTLAVLAMLATRVLAEAPDQVSRALATATPEARAFTCSQGLPALAFTSPRARVLADGTAAADLVLACSEAGFVQALDVAETDASPSGGARQGSEASAGPRVTYLHLTTRARARSRRMAVGAARYALIVVAPERPTGPPSLLSLLLPRVPSETVEGMRELLAALSSDGALFAVLEDEPAALRFALTAMEALRLDGAIRPSTHLVVQRAVDHYGVWVGRGMMPMDSLLELHARDRARREGKAQPPVSSLPPWAASAPTLLHTAVALFDQRMARLLHRQEQEPPPREPPPYAFDIAPLHDERPLFFEITRRDRPDTWVSGGSYVRALELLGLALAAWLVVGVGRLELRRRRIERRGGVREVIAQLLWVTSSAAVLAWSAQAMSRIMADAPTGTLVAVSGLALGAIAGWWGLRRRPRRRTAAGALAAAAAEVALALGAWQWTAVVARVDALQRAQGIAFALAICAVLGAASLWLLPSRQARPDTRALAITHHVCALLTAFAALAVTLLFGDFRAVGVLAAATGLLAVALPSHAGDHLHGSAMKT